MHMNVWAFSIPNSKGTVNSMMTSLLRFFQNKQISGMRLVTVQSGGTVMMVGEFRAQARLSSRTKFDVHCQ